MKKQLEEAIRNRNLSFDMGDGADIHWDDIARDYKACRNWDLVAAACGVTRGDLAQRFSTTCPIRAKQTATLEEWGQMLEAQAQIELLDSLGEVHKVDGADVGAYINEERQPKFDACTYLPKCCPAPNIFRGGWSVLEAEKILGDLPCPTDCTADQCREKCMLAEKIMLRITQTNKARAGHAGMAQYLGDVVLHQGQGANESFAPAQIVFED